MHASYLKRCFDSQVLHDWLRSLLKVAAMTNISWRAYIYMYMYVHINVASQIIVHFERVYTSCTYYMKYNIVSTWGADSQAVFLHFVVDVAYGCCNYMCCISGLHFSIFGNDPEVLNWWQRLLANVAAMTDI